MVMSSVVHGRVLVKLSEISQELTVGIGSAHASVRTLSGVSLEIRERELVVLSGNRGAGERALLSVIAGDRRGVTGSCEIRPDTRVRLLRITARAALALTQEWQRCETLAYFSALAAVCERDGELMHDEVRQYVALHNALRLHESDQPPDLILLDVVPDPTDPVAATMATGRPNRVAETPVGAPRASGAGARDARSHVSSAGAAAGLSGARPWDEKNRAALLAWAGICRLRGGAVVMAAGDAVGNGIFDAALNRVREASPGPRVPTAVREVRFDASTVRVVPMHSGRLAASVRLRTNDLVS